MKTQYRPCIACLIALVIAAACAKEIGDAPPSAP